MRIDPTLMGSAAPQNPNTTAFGSIFNGSVMGERTSHGYQDDGQDNAAVSPATVQLRLEAKTERIVIPANTIVTWSNTSNEIINNGCVVMNATNPVPSKGQGEIALRLATVLTPPEPGMDSEYVSVAMHPYTFHDEWCCGITQSEVVVEKNGSEFVTVGIQHKSELRLDSQLLYHNAVQPGEVIALGGKFNVA